MVPIKKKSLLLKHGVRLISENYKTFTFTFLHTPKIYNFYRDSKIDIGQKQAVYNSNTVVPRDV